MKSHFVVATFLGLSLGARPAIATVPDIVSDQDTPISVRDIAAQDGTVSGVVVNRSAHPVRDVELLVQRTFFWQNEFRPAGESPGRASFFKVPDQIPPGGSVPFTYHASAPLPERSDGHFDTSVQVVGFTQVGQ